MACTEKKAQLNDVGVVFVVTIKNCDNGTATAYNIASSTVRQIILKSPNGVTSTKTAVFNSDGTDGVIKYTTVSGDLNEVGTWRLQARVAFGSTYDYKTDIETFKVYENL
tara:strand:- start:242 stop:571 length:330 start_codon:yes stop_codon:yes gene_type:complete